MIETTATDRVIRLGAIKNILGLVSSGADWEGRAVYLAFLIADDADEDRVVAAARAVEAARPGQLQRIADFARDLTGQATADYLYGLSQARSAND